MLLLSLLLTLLGVAVSYILILAYFRLHFRRSIDLKIFQNRLYRSVKSFVESDETPDIIAEAAFTMFRISGIRNATFHFIAIASTPGKEPKKNLKLALNEMSDTSREKFAETLFDFLMVLKLRSVFFGWMVFPTVLNAKGPGRQRPRTFGDLSLNTLRKVSADGGIPVDC